MNKLIQKTLLIDFNTLTENSIFKHLESGKIYVFIGVQNKDGQKVCFYHLGDKGNPKVIYRMSVGNFRKDFVLLKRHYPHLEEIEKQVTIIRRGVGKTLNEVQAVFSK